jgi:hypothetical protein
MRFKLGVIVTTAAFLGLVPLVQAAGGPEDDVAGTIKLALSKSFNTDWQGLEKLTKIKWAPLPPTALRNCLPDGGCFTRAGTANIGGRNLVVLATGARTIVSNLYFRNPGAPIGEAALVSALKQAGFSAELARCPVSSGIGGTNWYRLKSAGTNPGYVSIQSSCNGKPCEGFTLTQGADLPPLQPNQLRLYSEQCSLSASNRKPVSTALPHEDLARAIVKLIPPSTGAAGYDWKTLSGLTPGAQWNPKGPMKGDLTFKGDPNPFMLTGSTAFSQRQFSLLASGSPTQVKAIYFDENGMHPSGENMMRAIWSQGFAVSLARCGPVYTESTNNWYRVTSLKTQPVMLKQSIRYEGKQVQDGYELRLDGTLPKRDPRDRDPGVNGCR